MTAPLPRPLRGPIVAIGGAEDKLQSQMILRQVVELAGASSARIVIIPTASRLKNTGRHYEALFRKLGASDVRVLALTCRAECGRPDTLEVLRNATGVFMTGGNQIRLSSVIGGTPVAKTIRQQNANGAVVAGTSAGAAVLSEHMIAYGREGATPRAGMVSIVPGLGLVNQVIIDQHFRQRDRLGRLLAALAYNPFAVGIGLDEDTAAVIDADDNIRVIGSNAVTLVDASALSYTAIGFVRAGEPVSLIGLKLHVLVSGGCFHLSTREAYPAEQTSTELARAKLAAADRDVKGVGAFEFATSNAFSVEEEEDEP